VGCMRRFFRDTTKIVQGLLRTTEGQAEKILRLEQELADCRKQIKILTAAVDIQRQYARKGRAREKDG